MTKPNPRRRDEILDAAEARFTRYGYLATSVAELIADMGIAKGTFYHHFASKDAVMHAVIERQVDRLVTMANERAGRNERPALERLAALFAPGGRPERSAALAAELEAPGNEVMHAVALAVTTRRLVPIVARVIDEGNAAGEFDAVDPVATAGVMLAASTQLLDDDVLGWRRDGASERIRGFAAVIERLLGVQPGLLEGLGERFASERAGAADARDAAPFASGPSPETH